MTNAYPLKLRFKLIALAPKVSLTDAHGKEILYIEQKLFALKESVKVFDNSIDKNLLYTIKANQLLDIGARYIFRDLGEKEIGSTQQEGMRSLYQASYIVFDKRQTEVFRIIQANPMIAILDTILSFIPLADIFSNFILNPTYTISKKENEEPVLTMKKKPSFFESNFEITAHEIDITEEQELLLLLSSLMLVQLERNRG
ncbi:MAG: hypothetical protein H0W89_00385 [Candidatus Levybacteria bacterium]|nr:hypothetical protein [Candidatus Levybacteria bacterium]